MKISPKFIKILIRLQNKERINGGEFKSYLHLVEPMFREGGLRRKQISKQRFEVSLINIDSFNLYINRKFNIEDLNGYLLNLQNPNVKRADMLTTSTDDKAITINPFNGVYIASYDDIDIFIDGKKTKLNTLNGTALFVSSACKLEISKELLVVGIENAENLHFIVKQIEYFSHIREKKIFVYRNLFMLSWLETIENNYLHYGDFDFVGISIYKSQILPRVKADKRFFIPSNMEELLEQGQSDLYYKHYAYKNNILGIDEEIDALIALIEDYKKTVRQEFLIEYKG